MLSKAFGISFLWRVEREKELKLINIVTKQSYLSINIKTSIKGTP